MLKRTIQICLPLLIVGLLMVPTLADAASHSYSMPSGTVGGVGYFGDGSIAAAIIFQIRNLPSVPSVNPAEALLSKSMLDGDDDWSVMRLYKSELLRGQEVVITKYVGSQANTTYRFHVSNLYQPDQKILGFEQLSGMVLP